jgi:hypothetical protein
MPEPIRTIKWAEGFRARVSAEDAHAAVEAIRQENQGSVTAEMVMEAAKPKDHVLHKQIYALSQKAAAREHYLEEARLMLRSFHVTFEARPDMPIRRYEVVSQKGADVDSKPIRAYTGIDDALSNEDYHNQVLGKALSELGRLQERYGHLSELSEVFDAIRRLKAA